MQIEARNKNIINTEIDLSIFSTQTIDTTERLFGKLEAPLIKANQMEITQRNLSHWVKVLEENKTGNKQKKYSFKEFVWLKIVEQLRIVNVGLETIKSFKAELNKPVTTTGILNTSNQRAKFVKDLVLNKSKKNQLNTILEHPDRKNDQSILSFLHLAIVENLINKTPLCFSVFSNGTFIISKGRESILSTTEQERLNNEPHIVVSISKIISDFLYSDLSGLVVPVIGLLSYGENKLFEVLHNGDYATITVSFSNNEIKPIELVKSNTNKSKLLDMLKDKSFSEIIVKKSKGVVMKIDRTVKVIL